jgi:hypothetical protein
MHRGPNGQGSEEPGTSSAPTQRSIKSMTTTVSRTTRRSTRSTHSLWPSSQRAECCNSEPRNRKSRPQPEGGQDPGGACDAGLRHSTANHGSLQALKVDKISEERATSDYAAPPQTAVVCKRHWRVSPLRRSTANCGSTQAPLVSVASAAAATAFTKTMGSRPKSTKPTRFAAASCKAESRSTRTAATITRSQLSSN